MPDLRMLMSGLIFGESPRWHDNRLWCIDVGAQEVIAVDLEGRSEVLVDVPNAYIGNLGFHAWRREEFRTGTIALVPPDDAAREVADGLAIPNGMVISPDNLTLIIAETRRARLMAFDISADGSLSNRWIWADLGGGIPDGICLDAENAVWYGNPRGGCVRVRQGGDVLQTIDVDLVASRACWVAPTDARCI